MGFDFSRFPEASRADQSNSAFQIAKRAVEQLSLHSLQSVSNNLVQNLCTVKQLSCIELFCEGMAVPKDHFKGPPYRSNSRQKRTAQFWSYEVTQDCDVV